MFFMGGIDFRFDDFDEFGVRGKRGIDSIRVIFEKNYVKWDALLLKSHFIL